MASGTNPAYPPAYSAEKGADGKAPADAPPPYAPPGGGNAGAYPTPYPPGQVPPPQPGFVVYPGQPGAPPPNQAGMVTTVTTVQAPGSTILVGNCPNCRVGIITEDFTLCGILCAFFFFPLGILCCLLMRERKCNRCGYHGM